MIPLDELKAYLGIEESDTSQDDRLVELERNAVAFIEAQTQRYFGPPQEFEEVLEGNGRRRLWLSEPPVEDPSDSDGILVGLAEAAYPGAAPTDPALEEGTDFLLRYMGNAGAPGYTGTVVRTGSGTVWTLTYEYTATYWRGYESGSEPGDIRQLVLDLVSVRQSLLGREGFRSESAPDYSYVRFGEGDLDAVSGGRATVDAWKRLVFA